MQKNGVVAREARGGLIYAMLYSVFLLCYKISIPQEPGNSLR
jgi:hypothetical protein